MDEPDAAARRRDRIVDAAIGVFLRYGYARATMGDIAQAAGLTRPTLYVTFPDKERIFAAVVEKMIADKLEEIRGGLPRRSTLETKLRFACDAWAADGYDLVQAHPDAADMFDLGFKSVCAGYQAFEGLIAYILKDAVDRSSLDLSPAKLARSIVYALKGFKDVAANSADLRTLIATHVAVVSTALSPLSRKDRTRPK